MHGVLIQVQLLPSLSFFHLESLKDDLVLPPFCVKRSIFELHRVMESPESLVTKHVLQSVPEVTNATNATWSILGVAGLLFVMVLSDHSINQTINHFI